MIPARLTLLATILLLLLAGRAQADEVKVEGTFGAWRVFSASDPMTDRTWFGASLASFGDQARLQVECETGKSLSAAIFTTRPLGNGIRDFQYRVDKGPAQSGVMNYSKNIGQPFPSSIAKNFIKDLPGGTGLLVRLTTYDHESIDFRFSLLNMTEAMERLSEICRPATELPTIAPSTEQPVPQQSALPNQPAVNNNDQPPKSPSPDARDTKNLEATLERLRSLQAQNQAPTRAAGGLPGGGGSNGNDDAKLSAADRGAIIDRIRECWTRDAGAKDADKMSTVLQIITDGTGTVRDVKIVQPGQGPSGIAFAERARRAALDPQCNPMPLPKGLLGKPRTFSLSFRP